MLKYLHVALLPVTDWNSLILSFSGQKFIKNKLWDYKIETEFIWVLFVSTKNKTKNFF